MPADQRAQLRAIIKRVHPDLFAADPDARAVNADSLKVLNAYCDHLASGQLPAAARLTFFVRDDAAAAPASAPAVPSGNSAGAALRRIEAVLPAHGSLAPLLHAFGLLSDAELQREEAASRDPAGDRQDPGLLTWLHGVVTEAVRAAEEAEATSAAVSAHRADIQHTYRLADLQAGTALTAGAAEQQRWLHALDMLAAALSLLTDDEPDRFAGLSVRLVQPGDGDEALQGWAVAADSRDEALSQQTHVTSSGCLHIIADEWNLLDAVDALDLPRARLLSRLSDFWNQQARSLVLVVRDLLGVSAVWHDSTADLAAQRFVLWASRLLEAREGDAAVAYAAALDATLGAPQPASGYNPDTPSNSTGVSGNGSGPRVDVGNTDTSGSSSNGSGPSRQRRKRRRLPLSVLVHCEMDGPPVELLASRRLLQVRHDCPPDTLMAVLRAAVLGDTFAAAGDHAQTQSAEAAVLEAARAALGARRLVRVCTHCTPDDVLAAVRRLIDHALEIRSAVDLTGASIAIDDRFEVWDSGYISVPFDFKVADLQSTLRRKLLNSGSSGGGGGGVPASGTAVAAGVVISHMPRQCILVPMPRSGGHGSRQLAGQQWRQRDLRRAPSMTSVMRQPRHRGIAYMQCRPLAAFRLPVA